MAIDTSAAMCYILGMPKDDYISPPVGSDEWETQRLRMVAYMRREVPIESYPMERVHCWEDLTREQRIAILLGENNT